MGATVMFSRSCCGVHPANGAQLNQMHRLVSPRPYQSFHRIIYKPRRHFASKTRRAPPPPLPHSQKPVGSRQQIQPQPLSHRPTPPVSDTFAVPLTPLAQSLARRSSPTLLYSNVGTADYTAIFSAIAGGYCIAYGTTWLYDAVYVEHPGLWRPINFMNGFGGIVIIGLGLSIWTRMRGQVGRIEAVPLLRSAARGGGNGGLMLKVAGRNYMNMPAFWRRDGSIVSLWRPKVLECAISDVRMKSSIIDTKLRLGAQTASERRHNMEGLLERDPAGGKVLAGPFSRAFRRLRSIFLKIFVGEGYVNMRVKGTHFRMDVKDGWLLDDGEALDRLLAKPS